MDIGDPSRALTAVEGFRDVLIENKAIYDSAGSEVAKAHQSHQVLVRRWPLIEDIINAADPESPRGGSIWAAGMWSWTYETTPVERLIGILSQREEHEAIFSPKGPMLAADRMHRWVWDASANLWSNGHYGPAVEAAAKAVEQQTQLKLNHPGLHGKDLYSKAFSTKPPEPDNPRLRFPDIDEEKQSSAWVSAHEGAQHLGMACAQGIRNPRAHSPVDLSEQEAIEQLAALSVLARWVETCEVKSG